MSIASRSARALFSLLFTLFVLLSVAMPQTAPDDLSTLSRQAFDLYKQGKFEDALPLFQKLNQAKPDDPQILEALAFSTYAHSKTLTDLDARKAAPPAGS